MSVILTDKNNVEALNLDGYASEIQTSGTDTYIGFALPGTALASAKWQAMKIDANGCKTWADGNSNFDNVATDLTALTYS